MAAEPPRLQAGRRVRLQGLKAAPELNGVVGRLRVFYEDRGRWAVALPGSAAPKLLKPLNLEPLEADLLDFANVLVDVLADDVVLRMFSFLPGRTLLDVGLTCGLLNERARGSAALWRSLSVALLGRALVLLHEEAWDSIKTGDKPSAAFWQSLFRAGYEGRRFQYAKNIRDRFPELDDAALKVAVSGSPSRAPQPPPPKSARMEQGGGNDAVVSDAERFTRALSASGHTASTLGHRIVVIGGWRQHTEEEDLYVCALDLQSMRLVEPRLAADSARPCRRLRHSSCVVRHVAADDAAEAVLVLGGCHDKTKKACPGLHSLLFLQFTRPDCSEMRWQEREATGEAPRAIWHHTAGAFAQGKRVVVFGGDFPREDPEFIHIGDRAYATHVYVLDVEDRLWQRVTTHGQVPGWRSLHAGVAYTSLSDGSEHFIIMGGCEREHLKIFSGGPPASMEGYSLNLETFKWECGSTRAKRRTKGARGGRFVPQARMRFAAERYGCHLLVYGGHGMEEFPDEEIFLTLNLMSLEWQYASIRGEPKAFPYAPAAVLASGCLVGGVVFTPMGVQPVPKLDFVCLCPPESVD